MATKRTLPLAKAFPSGKSSGMVMPFSGENQNRAVVALRALANPAHMKCRALCWVFSRRYATEGEISSTDGTSRIPPPEPVQMRFAGARRRSRCVDVAEPVGEKAVRRDAGRV